MRDMGFEHGQATRREAPLWPWVAAAFGLGSLEFPSLTLRHRPAIVVKKLTDCEGATIWLRFSGYLRLHCQNIRRLWPWASAHLSSNNNLRTHKVQLVRNCFICQIKLVRHLYLLRLNTFIPLKIGLSLQVLLHFLNTLSLEVKIWTKTRLKLY